MIAVLLITALFVFISVYFFFRAEKLQHALLAQKRSMAKIQKESQLLSKSMVIMANNTEEFAKKRLQLLLTKTKNQETLDELALIKPFIDCYALIFKACLMQQGKLQATTKTCFSSHGGDMYQEFVDRIIKQDPKIQRLWNSNKFIGFITLTEALLVKFEEQLHDSV